MEPLKEYTLNITIELRATGGEEAAKHVESLKAAIEKLVQQKRFSMFGGVYINVFKPGE